MSDDYRLAITVGTVRSVLDFGGDGFYSVQLDDAFTIRAGEVRSLVSNATFSVVAYACNRGDPSEVRNFGTRANVLRRFPTGRKVLLFTETQWGRGSEENFVSACDNDVNDACLVKGKPGCLADSAARARLISFASAHPDLVRVLSLSAASTCAPACQNGATCALGECQCTRDFMGASCETRRPPAPAVTVTSARIIPGAGSNSSDVWISGTTRTIKIPILSNDRTIPTGFARVMLLNLSPNPRCKHVLPNATIDGLPSWFFADSTEVDPLADPRYLFTQLLEVVDLTKLKWTAGTKAKATIAVTYTMATNDECKAQGSGFRIAVMLSATRSDDASLAGPFAGGQFTIAGGACLGDGVAGLCQSQNCNGVAAKTVTAGQCGSGNVCCIPVRGSASPAPVPAFTFMSLDVPRQGSNQSNGVAQFAFGEAVPLKWRINSNRPQASPLQLFWPTGFCAVEEGSASPSSTFELQLLAGSANGPLLKSYGRKALSLGGFDAALELPQNNYSPGSVVFVAKFSASCVYESAPISVYVSPCFSTSTKTLVGSCMNECFTWGDDKDVLGTCPLKGASKCCGKQRASNVGFRFADEDLPEDGPAVESTDSASSTVSVAAAAAGVAVAARML